MSRSFWLPVILGVVALYGLGQANHDLWLIDEPRDAEIAREMSKSGDWVVPTLNGEPFLEKPPLSYAAAALGLKLRPGHPEAGARLPSALFCLGTLLCTAWIGWRLMNPEVGLASALILGTSKEFLTIGHECLVDAGLFFWTALALAAALEGDRRDQKRWWLLSALGMGWAFLTKGPVGLAIPAVSIGLFLIWERGPRMLKGVPWAGMVLIIAAMGGAWLWALSRRGLLDAYVQETFRRAGPTVEHAHTWHYYLTRVFDDFAPWSVLIPFAALWLMGKGRHWARSLALPIAWFLGTLILLSIPASKRGIYLIPAFPALSVLTAALLLEGAARARWLLCLIAGLGLGAAAWLGWREGHRGLAESATVFAGILAMAGTAQALWKGQAAKALATAAAGLVVAWVYVLCVWTTRANAQYAVAVPFKSVWEQADRPPVAGLDLSEPVRGAVAFTVRQPIPVLKDSKDLASWLSGSPALAVIQARTEDGPDALLARLERDPALQGRFAEIGRAKLHHEVLLFIVAPEHLPGILRRHR